MPSTPQHQDTHRARVRAANHRLSGGLRDLIEQHVWDVVSSEGLSERQLDRLLATLRLDVEVVVASYRYRIETMRKRQAKEDRLKVQHACDFLRVPPPKTSRQRVDLKLARKNKFEIVQACHPDLHQNDHRRVGILNRAVEAFHVLETYNERRG